MKGINRLLAACAAALVWASPAMAQEVAAEDAFIEGNLYFLAYHEIGHLLLDQVLDADQSGDRLNAELTADDIATWLMLPDPDEPDLDNDIVAAMAGWMHSEAVNGPTDSPHYPDDGERAARIACYLYGSNPDLYGELAEIFPNSIHSVDCGAEFEALHADLEDWFGDHFADGQNQSGGRVIVRYAPATPALAEAQAFLAQSQVLEDAADDVSEFVILPHDVYLTAQSCGGGGAEFRYSLSRREIIACYEAVAWFIEGGAAAQQDGARRSDELGSGGSRVTRRPRPRPR